MPVLREINDAFVTQWDCVLVAERQTAELFEPDPTVSGKSIMTTDGYLLLRIGRSAAQSW